MLRPLRSFILGAAAHLATATVRAGAVARTGTLILAGPAAVGRVAGALDGAASFLVRPTTFPYVFAGAVAVIGGVGGVPCSIPALVAGPTTSARGCIIAFVREATFLVAIAVLPIAGTAAVFPEVA